jgi:hypothetical protein
MLFYNVTKNPLFYSKKSVSQQNQNLIKSRTYSVAKTCYSMQKFHSKKQLPVKPINIKHLQDTATKIQRFMGGIQYKNGCIVYTVRYALFYCMTHCVNNKQTIV